MGSGASALASAACKATDDELDQTLGSIDDAQRTRLLSALQRVDDRGKEPAARASPKVGAPATWSFPDDRPSWMPTAGVGNKNVGPTGWAMTLTQWHTFVAACRVTEKYRGLKAEKGFVTLYDVNAHFVMPWTRMTGNSVALLMNSDAPLPAKLMISHAWGEDVEELAVALASLSRNEALPEDTPIWFCTFAQYQPGGEPDDVGPTIGEQIATDPFKSVIESKEVREGQGMWVVHTTRAELYGRLWCVLEIVVAATEGVKVTAALSGLYAAQICDVRKLLGVKPRTENARCSVQSDEEMIRGTVAEKFASEGGFDFLDTYIFNFRASVFNEMRARNDDFVLELKSYAASVSADELQRRYDGPWMEPGELQKLQDNMKLLRAEASTNDSVCVGIDLGNSYVKVARGQSDTPLEPMDSWVIWNDQGNYSNASFVGFFDDGCVIGDVAKGGYSRNLDKTLLNTKRLIGLKFQDRGVQDDIKKVVHKVGPGPSDVPMAIVSFQGEEKKFYPEEVASMLLLHVKECAEKAIGTRVRNAVITVPASFTDEQRQRTKEAAALAGLNVLELLDDAMAVAAAYDFAWEGEGARHALICDFGGGTTTFTILRFEKGEVAVKASSCLRVGGMDLEDRLFQSLCDAFQNKNKCNEGKKDLRGHLRGEGRLRMNAEHVMRSLSSSMEASVDLDCLFDGIDFQTKVTRKDFEDLIADLVQVMREGLTKCFDDSGIGKNEVDKVVVVGGVSRIPKVRAMVQEVFEGKAGIAEATRFVDNLASVGAAKRAAAIVGAGVSARERRSSNRTFGTDLVNDVPQVEMRETLLRRELDLVNTYFSEKGKLDVQEDPHAMNRMFQAQARLERSKLNVLQARALAARDAGLSATDAFFRLERLSELTPEVAC